MVSKFLSYMAAVITMFGLVAAPALADVGVGISPSKMAFEISGGSEQSYEFLVFNSGDNPLTIQMSADGDIAPYVTFSEDSVVVQPEPKPHELPIKNGQKITVIFKAPYVSQTSNLKGTISAVGSSAPGQQFGGSVGVATLVEMKVAPAQAPVPLETAVAILAGILLVALAITAVRRSGLHLSFDKRTTA